MKSMTGLATFTFADGKSHDAEVSISFMEQGGRKSGSGTFRSKNPLPYPAPADHPIMECEGIRFRVILTSLNHLGSGTLVTTGGPLNP